MKEYLLVKDYVKDKPVALVRSEYARATAIASDKSSQKAFIDGDPHYLNSRYGFTLLDHISRHPDISHYIGLIVPVMETHSRLERARKKAAKATGFSQSFVQRRVSSASNDSVSCLPGEY